MRLSPYVSVQTLPGFPRNFETWRWYSSDPSTGASIMGKYLLGWIMGVPLIVLVIIYLLFN